MRLMKSILIIFVIGISLFIGSSFTPKSKTETISVVTNSSAGATQIINKMCNNGWTLDQSITQPISVSITPYYYTGEYNTKSLSIKGDIILVFKR